MDQIKIKITQWCHWGYSLTLELDTQSASPWCQIKINFVSWILRNNLLKFIFREIIRELFLLHKSNFTNIIDSRFNDLPTFPLINHFMQFFFHYFFNCNPSLLLISVHFFFSAAFCNIFNNTKKNRFKCFLMFIPCLMVSFNGFVHCTKHIFSSYYIMLNFYVHNIVN